MAARKVHVLSNLLTHMRDTESELQQKHVRSDIVYCCRMLYVVSNRAQAFKMSIYNNSPLQATYLGVLQADLSFLFLRLYGGAQVLQSGI